MAGFPVRRIIVCTPDTGIEIERDGCLSYILAFFLPMVSFVPVLFVPIDPRYSRMCISFEGRRKGYNT
jgi:hypothetical protein